MTNERGIQFNRQYGHQDFCMFGNENSGMCNCGQGFDDKPYVFKEKPVAKSSTAVLTSTPGQVACQSCGCLPRPLSEAAIAGKKVKRDCPCGCHQ